MKTRDFIIYLLIAFGLCWSVTGAFIFFPERTTAIFGELSLTNPLFFLATYAPAIAAFFLVLRHTGWSGFKRYLSRLLLWQVHWGWYAILLIGIPLCFYIGATIKQLSISEMFPITSIGELLPVLFLMLFLGPVEEFGWRGFALPLLQRAMAPIWAGLILGIIWSIWHIPAFLLSGTPQAAWAFMPFFAGSVSVSVVVTALFNSSRGSLLLPILFHWQLVVPAWPDAQPYDHIAFVTAAVVVVFLFRRSMFNKAAGITEVVPNTSYKIGNIQSIATTSRGKRHA
jgi:membrane protease YdiL (CAAX protease family)